MLRVGAPRLLTALALVLLTGAVAAWPGEAKPTRDSDRDGVSDARERAEGCNPLRRDSDRDGMLDRSAALRAGLP